MEINFYNFKKIMNISSELDLSLPGIKLKPAPQTTIVDSEIVDGIPSQETMDIDTGEFKDERVNFLYDADSSFIEGGVAQRRYKGTEVTDLEDANGDDLIKYPTPVVLPDNTLSYPPASLVVNGSNLPIRPAHEFLMDDSFTQTSRKVLNDRIWLAGCGVWPTEGFNLRKFIDYNNTTKSAVLDPSGFVRVPITIDSKAKPWISIKDFQKKLKEMRNLLSPRGIDVVSTPFEKSLDINGVDLNDSKISRKVDRNYSKVKPKSTSFIESPQPNGRNDLLSPLSIDEISPFDVSIQTVQLALGPDDEELFDDLVNIINDVRENYSAIKAKVVVNTGSVVSSTAATIVLGGSASSTDGAYNNHVIEITTGPGSVQRRTIYTYVGSTKTATISPNWDTALFPLPNSSSNYKILKPSFAPIDADTPQEQFPAIIIQTRSLANKIKYSDVDGLTLAEDIEGIIAFHDFKQSISILDQVIKKIEWFEFFQGISLRKNRVSILTGNQTLQTQNYRKLSRILVPVDMGVKVTRVRRRANNFVEAGLSIAAESVLPFSGALSFGFRRRRRYKYIKTDLGIRFFELRFVDASVLSKFRKNEYVLLNNTLVSATSTTATLPDIAYAENSYYTNYSIEIMSGEAAGQIKKIVSYDGASRVATIDSQWGIIPLPGTEFKIYKAYEVTNPDPVPLNINLSFDMPHLPFDAELRKMAFDNLGFFDNTANANHSEIRDVSGNILVNFDNFTVVNQNSFSTFYPGYEIFHDTSKEVSAMRGGLDIYNKVQFLITILKDKFSPSRVKLIETMRSLEDQNKIQFGGDSSNFLSWHNYGLAAKIIVTDETEVTPIKDGSPDFFKLVDVADVFTSLCFNGSLGEPINVVWCGRLQTGPDNFVWEFLPLGVDHKDAWKFRDALYNQIDPVVANAYVDVQSNNYIVPASSTSTGPYIKENSEALKNPIVTNGGTWVSPSDIRNYDVPSNLVLKDIQEFLFMIKNKITGNGSTLTANRDPFSWKSSNPISYNQLINYHSLLGNYNIVRLLLSMDYIDRFEPIVITANTLDSRDFVRSFLGDVSYNNAKINIKVDADSGFISIADGKLYVLGSNVTNNNPEGNGNTFGQKQLSTDSVTIEEVKYVLSDAPVLTEKQIKVINSLVRDKILNEYKLIKDAFANINIEFLYDSIKSGSNAELFDTIENEFGIIKTQDLIPIQQIRELFNRVNINNNPENTSNPDGTLRGAAVSSEESVYEKLISTLETAEVSLVKPGNEKIIVEEVLEKPLEVYIRAVIKKQDLGAADLL